jgi:hypothetical protein
VFILFCYWWPYFVVCGLCRTIMACGCLLLFWWGRFGRVALHQLTWSKKLNNNLKFVISPLSKTKSESFTIPFFGSLLNSAGGCIKTAVTIVVVTENVHMSRRWKAESVAYGICKQPLLRFAHPVPLNPDRSPVCPDCPESVQHLILTSKSHIYQTVHRNRPYE